MIVGEPSIAAIESSITRAYERLSLRALGYFVIYVKGSRYGVCSPHASMLANSFDEVERRIADRGKHTSFIAESGADQIAEAVSSSLYSDGHVSETIFGVSQAEFSNMTYSHRLLWAPDGDEAFDDGSHILQFDIHDRVRLVAFRCSGRFDPFSVSDIYLAADRFYGILQEWRDRFEDQWASMPKVLEV